MEHRTGLLLSVPELVLGESDFVALVSGIRALRQGVSLLSAQSADEADRKLGPLQPTLLIVDGRGRLLSETGRLLHSLRERNRSGRIPILVAVDAGDPLLAPDVSPLVSLGGPPLPVERLARALRERLPTTENHP